jgi:hypothetical protein
LILFAVQRAAKWSSISFAERTQPDPWQPGDLFLDGGFWIGDNPSTV